MDFRCGVPRHLRWKLKHGLPHDGTPNKGRIKAGEFSIDGIVLRFQSIHCKNQPLEWRLELWKGVETL
jgi:hypothetical protein